MPQCQFLFIMSVHCRKGPKMKVLRKIWKNYRNSISPEDSGSQKDKSRGGPQPPHAPWARLGLGRPQGWCRCLGHRLATPFGLYIASAVKTLKESTISPEEFRSSAATKNPNSGDISLCFGILPGRGIAPGAISIDATASIIAVAASHDEEGPRGWGLYR